MGGGVKNPKKYRKPFMEGPCWIRPVGGPMARGSHFNSNDTIIGWRDPLPNVEKKTHRNGVALLVTAVQKWTFSYKIVNILLRENGNICMCWCVNHWVDGG